VHHIAQASYLVMHHDVGKAPCKELSAEKKDSQLSQVVTELLRFEVVHLIFTFQKKSVWGSSWTIW